MDETKTMLRTIINSQSAFRQEVLKKIDIVEKKVDTLGEKLEEKIDTSEKNLTERIDKLGKQLAYLEDDAPTREEFDNLEEKVNKIEHKNTPNL